METVAYYTQKNPPVKFSYFRASRNKYKLDFKNRLVTIITYCLMPNHFHFLVRQEKDGGIRTFIQKTLNAYSHYFNLKNKQKGPLFESPFKAIIIESDEQLLHLSRYIHLNPVTGYLVEKPQDYEFSSCRLFLNNTSEPPFDVTPVLEFFKKSNDYFEFLMARKEYQRELERIKHLILEWLETFCQDRHT